MARQRTPPPSTPLERLQALFGTALGRWLLRGVVAAVLLLVGGVVVRQARARAWTLPAYRLGPASLRYVGLPRRLDPGLKRQLVDARRLPISVSIFDPAAEDQVRGVVARHPLVAAVDHVRVRYPDRVDVQVRLREPAAYFRVQRADGRKGFVLVSRDGRLLDPKAYQGHRQRVPVPMPRVHGVRARPPRYTGQAWQDLPEQVAEGIAAAEVAARLYADFNGTLSVKTIDVSAFPAPPERRGDGEVRFVLQDGTVVEWGRTERDLHGVAGEDSYETKRWRLELERTRWAGHPTRRRRIDVRFRLPGEGDALATTR